MKTLLKYTFLAAAIAALSGMAYANTAVIALSTDGSTWTVVSKDQTASDANPDVGKVAWIGNFNGWTGQIESATTYPVLGSLTQPILDLSYGFHGNGTLYVAFSANGFGPTLGGTLASIGNNSLSSSTSVTYSTYEGSGDNPNFLLNEGILLSQLTISGANGTSISGLSINAQGPFSLTQVVEIQIQETDSRLRNTTGDASLTTVPDSGTTLMLLGAGLAGLGLVNRLRRRIR